MVFLEADSQETPRKPNGRNRPRLLADRLRSSPEAMLLSAESDRMLDGALADLDVERRSALLMRIDHGLGYGEIAAAMGWSLPKGEERDPSRAPAASRASRRLPRGGRPMTHPTRKSWKRPRSASPDPRAAEIEAHVAGCTGTVPASWPGCVRRGRCWGGGRSSRRRNLLARSRCAAEHPRRRTRWHGASPFASGVGGGGGRGSCSRAAPRALPVVQAAAERAARAVGAIDRRRSPPWTVRSRLSQCAKVLEGESTAAAAARSRAGAALDETLTRARAQLGE